MSTRKPLSDLQFREICLDAAARSSDWPDYIREACIGLRAWLGDKSPREAKAPSPEGRTATEEERVQAEVNGLYKTLGDRCEYEFSVTDVLNEALADSGQKWQ